ncbi:hypothetical protein AJ79_02928 [Helicocarpus griseus UAMH5409]|uniref:Major facilitator superfamily (MFS) profile domain-containing protein n=1 Tax=Helicocarpus griseus UAMH5409 TaxID=1447875 RepID=A0A2B7Y0M8_9EURO|nr:hypothetical protein AJ79_02928 [Helicocarpus griseus UAMH5409]
MTPETLAKVRIYWLAMVACIGGFLFGYDSGIVGGVLTFKSFQTDFRYTDSQVTQVNSLTVGIQQLGCLVGCFAIWPVANRHGRKPAIILSSIVFCIGVVIEVINTHSRPAFYVGRVICGLGVGASSVIIPIYMAEMSPKEIRGRLGSSYQFLFTWGIFTSYWVDYGVKFMPDQTMQWQIPIGLQMVPGGLMGLGMLTLKESTRWLIFHGDHEAAWESLTWIRAGDSDAIRAEFDEMIDGVESDRRIQESFHPKELLEKNNFKRVLIAFGVFLAQQSTGSTALAYFGPQFFALLVGKGDQNLLLTAIFGAIKVAACGIFVIFIAERFGRRTLFISGAAVMACCMITTSAVVKLRPPPGNGTVTSAGIATVFLIYLDIIFYNWSWGGLPWAYVSEIFPPRIREPGVGIAVGTQWAFNLMYSFTTPYMMDGMGWGTFLLFGAFDLVIVIFVVFCIKETQGRMLEEINASFEGHGGGQVKDMSGGGTENYGETTVSSLKERTKR